jgi:hypothetical protein
MVKELRAMVQDALGHPIKTAVASFPRLIALYEEDVWDSFEWAALEHMQIMPYSGITYQYISNYAANGFGLCSDYIDADKCMKEIHNIRHGNSTFNIQYTRDAFVVEWPILYGAYIVYIEPSTVIHDPSLGSEAGSHDEDYWQRIRGRIEQLIFGLPGRWKCQPAKNVFVTGESAGDETFKLVLKDACRFGGNDPAFFEDDILFLGAKGSAELAKRAVYLNPKNRPPAWL